MTTARRVTVLQLLSVAGGDQENQGPELCFR